MSFSDMFSTKDTVDYDVISRVDNHAIVYKTNRAPRAGLSSRFR